MVRCTIARVCREKGVRLAQKMQVGARILVGVQLHAYRVGAGELGPQIFLKFNGRC
jgi:hypothetical protein